MQQPNENINIMLNKIIPVLEEINKIDYMLINKYKRNTNELKLCGIILDESKKNLDIIVENLK